ncbi:uncharacterized protein [Argopecten irradians]|uniref:uncharacterized protein n=1 Tax=Argopecten irradians TaxID=31199 RepID=UPI0037211977
MKIVIDVKEKSPAKCLKGSFYDLRVDNFKYHVIGTSVGWHNWQEDLTNSNHQYSPSILIATASSSLECLLVCSDPVEYLTTSFNNATGECHCLNGITGTSSQPGNRIWFRKVDGFTNIWPGWYVRLVSDVTVDEATAVLICSNVGARLAVLDTNDKINRITALPDYPSGSYVLVGATDKQTEGVYMWSTGVNVTDSRWATGDPNNGGIPGVEEDCVALSSSFFIDLPCTHLAYFVCEKV